MTQPHAIDREIALAIEAMISDRIREAYADLLKDRTNKDFLVPTLHVRFFRHLIGNLPTQALHTRRELAKLSKAIGLSPEQLNKIDRIALVELIDFAQTRYKSAQSQREEFLDYVITLAQDVYKNAQVG
jgi:hypothetical protein